MQKELIKLPRATLDFYRYERDGLLFYEFDATASQPPEPMVNTIVGLNALQNEQDRLVGIFFHEPIPLYERLGSKIIHEATELESGDFRIVFKRA